MSYNNQITLANLLKESGKQNQASINTCIPARIESYDHNLQKATVKPLIKIKMQDGQFVDTPIITNVPVMQPFSGGALIHLPVKKSDIVLLFFCDRNIENFLQNGGLSEPNTTHLHSINDAIAIPAKLTFNKQSGVSNNDDVFISYGSTNVQLKKNGQATIDATQTTFTGNVIVAGNIQVNGTEGATVSGSITSTGEVTANGIPLSTHRHTGDDGGNTSGPKL